MSASLPPDIEILIAGYVLNDLEAQEAARLKQLRSHAELGPKIEAALEQLEQTVAEAYLPEAVQPPTSLREAIMSNAEMPATASPADGVLDGLKALPRWSQVFGGLATAAVIGLAVSTGLLWQTVRSQQLELADLRTNQAENLLAQPPIELMLQSTDAFQPAVDVAEEEREIAVALQLNVAELTGTLSSDNLPPLPPGQVYVVWTVLAADAPFTKDEKNAVLTHAFSVETSDGKLSQSISLPMAFRSLDQVKALAITIENAAAPQQHEASPILIQKLEI